ncbi:MAG: CD3324 family protein [Sporomusaceae bacterium]|nr:CD3324 family protein [Sporomusaceae bacterium]
MGYKNAGNILPQGLLAAVQAYIDGEYLYIPRKECNKQAWGTLSKSKQYFSVRNAAIRAEHQAGMSVKKLSAQYCLSIKTIYKIIVSGRPG